MNHKEIERKWIVDLDQLMNDREKGIIKFETSYEIFQGYITTIVPDYVIRYRVNESLKRSFHTFKHHIRAGEATEIEVEIPYPDGKAFVNHCDKILYKKRRIIFFGSQKFEVDFFDDGLVIAELELNSLKDKVYLPEWCGEEVTGKKEYSNFSLARKNPNI